MKQSLSLLARHERAENRWSAYVITGKGKHSQMSAYTPLKGNCVRYCNTPMHKQIEEPKGRDQSIMSTGYSTKYKQNKSK